MENFKGKLNGLQQLGTLMLKVGKRLQWNNWENITKQEKVESMLKEEKNTDTSQLLKNGEKENKEHSSEIIKVQEYEIFSVVTTEEGTFVAMGNNRISKMYNTVDEAQFAIDNRDWELLFNVVATTSNAIIKTNLPV